MKIEILGTGCPTCKQLEENVNIALKETGVKADVVKVTDINKIIGYGIMSTPAIVIDGEVKSFGKLETPDKIKEWLE